MFKYPDGEWFQWALMAVGAFFGGQAAYNASNGNLFATLAGAIAGGFIGYNAGMGLETALTNAGISQNLGFSFEYAGAQVNATVLSGYGGQLSAGFGWTGGAAGAVGFASLLRNSGSGDLPMGGGEISSAFTPGDPDGDVSMIIKEMDQRQGHMFTYKE